MSSKADLKLDWCSYQAAKYAVEHWHYSQRMPRFKLVSIGVWESGVYRGAICFGQGATPEIGKQFGLGIFEVCELTRVALNAHVMPVTRMVAIALKMLSIRCPGLRLVVSFADSAQGHSGGIYRGGNWVYVGATSKHAYVVNGVTEHPKTLHSRYGKGGQSVPWLRRHIDPTARRIKTAVKHKYLMPLDEEMRARLIPLAQRYPKRATSETIDTAVNQTAEGGAAPTVALQIERIDKAEAA